jgi:hypothetical protein
LAGFSTIEYVATVDRLGLQRVSENFKAGRKLQFSAHHQHPSPVAMAAAAAGPSSSGHGGGRFQDKEKPQEVRRSNITAAKGPP